MSITGLNISITLHIFGLIMWMGSLLLVSRILALSAKNGDSLDQAWPKKILFGWLVPGMVITIVTGLFQASVTGFSYYFKQGWFHGKLTLVIVLTIISLIFIKQFLSSKLSFKSLMMTHGLSGLCLLIIIALTIMGTN